jgi:hypothetical protein
MTRTEYPNKNIVPNWSGTGTVIDNNGVIPSDGFLVVHVEFGQVSGDYSVCVNGILVWKHYDHDEDRYHGDTGVIPVAKNDVITFPGGKGKPSVATATFFPAKPASTTTSEADILEEKINKNAADIAALSESILGAVYPVGSVYIDANNAATCPMAAVMSGSTWTKIGSKLLTEASEAPVVGNGMTLGVSDGTTNAGLQGIELGILRADPEVYGTSVGTAPATTIGSEDLKSLSVTTDPDKSGLVAKLGDATGLSVTLWKRTA